MGKSFCKGNQVLMHDGSLQNVENIKVGDLLMGPDSKPREVLFLGAPAHIKTAPIDAAIPVQIVATSGFINCIVS